jgi:hypothetical protein
MSEHNEVLHGYTRDDLSGGVTRTSLISGTSSAGEHLADKVENVLTGGDGSVKEVSDEKGCRLTDQCSVPCSRSNDGSTYKEDRKRRRDRDEKRRNVFLFAMHQRCLPSFNTNYSGCYIREQQRKELDVQKELDKRERKSFSMLMTDRSEFLFFITQTRQDKSY